MTQDAEGPGPQDPPPPPTRTQWSQDRTIDEAGLLPPFVPGQRWPAADLEPVLDAGEGVPDTSEEVTGAGEELTGTADGVDSNAAEPDTGPPMGDESFPFDVPVEDESAPFYGWPAADSPDVTAESGDGVDDAFADVEMESPEAPLGDAGPEAAEVMESGVLESEALEFEVLESEVHELEFQEAEVDELEFPETEILEAEVQDAGVGPMAAPEDHLERNQAELAAGDPLMDIAAHLELLADRIRAEGRSGIEREMASLDRFSSLIAGVVAGYLAGLHE